jgi:hypothetical protein
MKKITLILAIVCSAFFATSVSTVAIGDTIVAGNITEVLSGTGGRIGSSVDHWSFTVNTAGTITIDTLSWEGDSDFEEVPVTTDVNGDGEIAFIDSYIYLFHDDGSLDSNDYINDNDDSGETFDDGSISDLDAYLSIDLDAGNYILAIGAYDLLLNDAINGFNPDSFYPVTIDEFGNELENDHGDYQITFTGDVTVSAVPVPAAAW